MTMARATKRYRPSRCDAKAGRWLMGFYSDAFPVVCDSRRCLLPVTRISDSAKASCNGQNRVRERLENGFPRIGHANPFADLAGDSDKMRQGRVAVVPHARGAVAVPGCWPGKWYETNAGCN